MTNIQYTNATELTPVLDKGFVQLLDTMPKLRNDNVINSSNFTNLDSAVVAAARASYGNELKGRLQDIKLLRYLIEHEHSSPLEQVIYQFRIKCPLMVLGHFVRHRTARLNVQSFRYVEAKEDEFYIPKEWRFQDKENKQKSYASSQNEIAVMSNEITDYILALDLHIEQSIRLYKKLLRLGVAKEQARLFLPANAQYTTFIYQMDLRNLLHFLHLRLGEGAQWETRQYAQAMLEYVKDKNPMTVQIYRQLGKL